VVSSIVRALSTFSAREMKKGGFAVAREVTILLDQYFLIFQAQE
jgi:hypothetical protein